MSTESKNVISLLNKNKILVLILVSIISIQNLVFQIYFKLNFPYSVDFVDIFTPVFDYIVKGDFTFFVNKGIHIIFFPKLVALPNLYFNSFDVVNLTYVYWIIISLTVFVMYLIIKQTDKKLIWTIIPISAFLYSPLTSSGYFMLVMLEWYFPMLGISLLVYFLNKNKITSKIFSSSIFLAIFSTFSILLGVVSWIVGLVMLLKPTSEKTPIRKIWICLWIISSTLVGLFYITLSSSNSEILNLDLLFSYTGFSFITNFISSSFRLKYEILPILIGSFSIFLTLIYSYYFIKKDFFKNYFPWFTFIFVAFCASIITALGRIHLEDHFGNEPYYSPISQFFQIGLIILTSKIIIDFRIDSKTLRKKIILIFLVLILISQMILLVPSYYSGWQRGAYYFDEKSEFINCFTLYPEKDCLQKYPAYDIDFLLMINYLIEKKLSIFADSNYINQDNTTKKFNSLNTSPLSLQNNFSLLDGKSITNNLEYNITEELFQLDGWFTTKSDSIPTSLFLLIDGNPIHENKNFELIYNSDPLNYNVKVNWSIFFLSGHIESGCHLVQLASTTNFEKTLLENKLQICK